MSDNVIHANFRTCADLPPDLVIKAAGEAGLSSVMLIGWTKDGELYLASSQGDAAENLFMTECARHELMRNTLGE